MEVIKNRQGNTSVDIDGGEVFISAFCGHFLLPELPGETNIFSLKLWPSDLI
jgi:hypothetical protein